jgi:hypothetical protein
MIFLRNCLMKVVRAMCRTGPAPIFMQDDYALKIVHESGEI